MPTPGELIIIFLLCAVIVGYFIIHAPTKKRGLGFQVSFLNHSKIKIEGDTNMKVILKLDEELIIKLLAKDGEGSDLGIEPGSQKISEPNPGDDAIATVVKGSDENAEDENYVHIKANALGARTVDVTVDGKGGDVVNQTLNIEITVVESDAVIVEGVEAKRYKTPVSNGTATTDTGSKPQE